MRIILRIILRLALAISRLWLNLRSPRWSPLRILFLGLLASLDRHDHEDSPHHFQNLQDLLVLLGQSNLDPHHRVVYRDGSILGPFPLDWMD
jgi:hypothetical protein